MRQDTHMRQAISPEERLSICLRYLATGDSFRSIAFAFRMGASTVAGIVHQNTLGIPDDSILPGAEHLGPMPHVFLADEAFPLRQVAENVVKATCMLHNFLRWDASTTIPARSSTGTSTAEPSQGLQNAPRLGTNIYGRDVVAVREKFAQYFMSEAGRVPWQDNI
ncbi:unnamed protein product [Gadus morhua 'NCC']